MRRGMIALAFVLLTLLPSSSSMAEQPGSSPPSEPAAQDQKYRVVLQDIIDAYERIHQIPRLMVFGYHVDLRSPAHGDVQVQGQALVTQHRDRARWETQWETIQIEGSGNAGLQPYRGYNPYKTIWTHDGKKTHITYVAHDDGQRGNEARPPAPVWHHHLDHTKLDEDLPQRFTQPLRAPEFVGVLLETTHFEISEEPLNGGHYTVLRSTHPVEVSHMYTWHDIAFFARAPTWLVERMEVRMVNHNAPAAEQFQLSLVLDVDYQFYLPDQEPPPDSMFTMEMNDRVKDITPQVDEFARTQMKALKSGKAGKP